MALVDLVSEDIVKVPIAAEHKSDLIRELVEVLGQAGRISGTDKAYEAVQKRESLGSTGLEGGVAVSQGCRDRESDPAGLGLGDAQSGQSKQGHDGSDRPVAQAERNAGRRCQPGTEKRKAE